MYQQQPIVEFPMTPRRPRQMVRAVSAAQDLINYGARNAVSAASNAVGPVLGYAAGRLSTPSSSAKKRKAVTRVAGVKRAARQGDIVPRFRIRRRRRKQSLTTKVNKLMKKVNDGVSVFTWKQNDFFQITVPSNAANYADRAAWSRQILTSMLDGVGVNDIDSKELLNSTIISQSIPVSTFARLTIRNNWEAPVDVVVYVVEPKVGTTKTYNQTYEDAFDTHKSAEATNEDATNTLIYPTELPEFNKRVKVISTSRYRLKGGDECIVKTSAKHMYQQQSITNPQSTTKDVKYSRSFFIRTVGVLGHGIATDTQLGRVSGKLDVMVERVYRTNVQGIGNTNQFFFDQNDTLGDDGTVAGPNIVQIQKEG